MSVCAVMNLAANLKQPAISSEDLKTYREPKGGLRSLF